MKPRNGSEWGVALGAMAAFACAWFDFALGAWATGIALMALALVQMMGIYTKRLAYFCGWMAGRSNLVASMAEAQHREMEPVDFWTSVIETDAAMTVAHMGRRQYRRFREQG